MPLVLYICSKSDQLLSGWAHVFNDTNCAILKGIDIRSLLSMPEIDAVLMPGLFAHERYGGNPRAGEAQILSTRGESGMPPWVVTTPPNEGSLEQIADVHSSERLRVVTGQQRTPEGESYRVFKSVFAAVKEFNWSHEDTKINKLGFELDFLNFAAVHAREEARGAFRAFVEEY